MNRFVIFSLFILSFSLVATAQSGRKVAAQPTPDATVSDKSKDENAGYSESKPLPKRSVSPFPTLRSVPKNDAQTKTPAKTKEAEILSDSEDETVTVETTLITIPVSVFDRNGLYIPSLLK